MTTQVQALWKALDDYKAHIATAELDFSIDNNYRVNCSNMLYDGSVIVRPKYVCIDNLSNPSPVSLVMNGIEYTVVPYERIEKPLSGDPSFVDVSASFGKCTIYISEVPFASKTKSDNLYGNIYPSFKTFQQTVIAATVGGHTSSHTVNLKKGETVIWIVDGADANFNFLVNNSHAKIDALETFNWSTWPGGSNVAPQVVWFGHKKGAVYTNFFTAVAALVNYRCGAALARYGRVFAMRAIADVAINIDAGWPVGIGVKYSSFIIKNCNGDILDHISDCYSDAGGSNPVIPSVAPATVYNMATENLSELNEFVIMLVGVTNATLASAESIGSLALTEINENNSLAISYGNIAKAGTTDVPKFAHAAAAGQTLTFCNIYLKGS